MVKQVLIIIPLLIVSACAQEDEAIKERNQVCTLIGCSSIIRINFTTPRTQDFRVTLEKQGAAALGGECTYNVARARFELADSPTSRAAACTASQIVVFANGFDRESAVTLEVFDALNVSLERKQYALVWGEPSYPNGKNCGGACYAADITTAAP